MEKNKRKNEVFTSSEFIRRYRAMAMEKLVHRSKVEKINVVPITYSCVILLFFLLFLPLVDSALFAFNSLRKDEQNQKKKNIHRIYTV